MLTIRDAQMRALAAEREAEFTARAIAHLQRWMPQHCAMLGDTALPAVVAHGWRKARSHGLGAECTVLSYLDTMCVLGSHFDADPLLPQIAAILAEPEGVDPRERGDRMYVAVWAHVDAVVPDYRDAQGKPRTEGLVRLLRAARGWPREGAADDVTLVALLSPLLAEHFPAKLALVGGVAAVPALVQRARARVACHGLCQPRSLATFAVLLFVLGHGFDDDPLLQWIPPVLAAGDAEEARIDQLLAQGAAQLRRWWDLGAARAAG
jgi:hypothetical protein